MDTKTPLQAYLALGVGVVILGFSAIFIRLANAPGVVSAFYRVGIAALVMGIPFYRRVRAGKSQLTRRGVWIALLAGLFFGIDLALWASGIMLGGATKLTDAPLTLMITELAAPMFKFNWPRPTMLAAVML